MSSVMTRKLEALVSFLTSVKMDLNLSLQCYRRFSIIIIRQDLSVSFAGGSVIIVFHESGL